MRVVFITEGSEVPSGRFRAAQLIPHFERAGIECAHRFAYGSGYNLSIGRAWGTAYKVACRLRRAAHTVGPLRREDVLVVQKVSLPISAAPERLSALLGHRIVFDVDDAIFLAPGGGESPFRKHTFDLVARAAKHVIVGNQFLASHIDRSRPVDVIPTVIDTDIYTPPARPVREREIIFGWMGTASNFPSLRGVLPQILQGIDRVYGARLRIVSNARLPELEGNARVDQIAWSAGRELEELRSFDVGLMPLDDTLAARGKCGFKLIQYMAVGRPVLASAVGANIDILSGSGAGQLVQGPSEWPDAMQEVGRSLDRRTTMGEAARARAVQSYSVASVIDRYLSIFQRVAGAA
jgi:glycosyltransferase involved in cell wall biosynthesis